MMKSLLVSDKEKVVREKWGSDSPVGGSSRNDMDYDVYPPNTNMMDVLTTMHQLSPYRRSIVLGDSGNAACILERTPGGVMASAIKADNPNDMVDEIVQLCAGSVVPQAVCFVNDDSSFSQITQFLHDHLHEPV